MCAPAPLGRTHNFVVRITDPSSTRQLVDDLGERRMARVARGQQRLGDRPRRCRSPGRSRRCRSRSPDRTGPCTCIRPARPALTTQKPCAKPGRDVALRKFAADERRRRPIVRRSASRGARRRRRRRSRPRSRGSACPAAARAAGAGRAACRRTDREWLSCTNGPAMPCSRYLLGVIGLEKKPAAVPWTSGSMTSDARESSSGTTRTVRPRARGMRSRYWPYALDPIARASRVDVGGRDVAHAVGDLLEARDHQALALLDGLDEVRRLHQRLVRAGVEPRDAARRASRRAAARARDTSRLTSVISSSPRADGFSVAAMSTTWLS